MCARKVQREEQNAASDEQDAVFRLIESLTCQVAKQQETEALMLHILSDVVDEVKRIMAPIAQDDASDESTHQGQALHSSSLNRLLIASRKLTSLVNAKAEGDELVITGASISELLRIVIGEFEIIADERKIELQFPEDEEEVMLYFDKRQIEQVMRDVLAISINCTDSYGKIRASLTYNLDRDGKVEQIEILIRDTGAGFLEDEIQVLFDPGSYLDRLLKTPEEQPVLGLYRARDILRLHGGDLVVESEPGFGTEYRMTLCNYNTSVEGIPKGPAETLKMSSSLAGTSMVHPERKKLGNLLLVDDNPDLCTYIQSSLESLYTVLVAHNGDEGLQMALQHKPDLVIADCRIPMMNGHQLCRHIRQAEELCHIPVILMTSLPRERLKIQCFQDGADQYMVKPFLVDELLARVGAVMRRQNHVQHRFIQRFAFDAWDEIIEPEEKPFVEKLHRVVQEHVTDSAFDVGFFAEQMHMHPRTLQRRVKQLLNTSPLTLIKEVRLEKARQLLSQGAGSVKYIAYKTGFKSSRQFSRRFADKYGMLPTDFVKEKELTIQPD